MRALLVVALVMSYRMVNRMKSKYPTSVILSPSDVGARAESKDPENLSLTMRHQGIFTRMYIILVC